MILLQNFDKEYINFSDYLFQGLVTNGAKVYIIALPTEPMDEKVAELNEIGRTSGAGGTAHGRVHESLPDPSPLTKPI